MARRERSPSKGSRLVPSPADKAASRRIVEEVRKAQPLLPLKRNGAGSGTSGGRTSKT